MCFDIDTQKHIGQTYHAGQINYEPVPICAQAENVYMLIMLNVTIWNF